MLADVSRPITTPIKKVSSLGMSESQALLDLCPEAVLLVDLRENRIVLANSRATELTAFTRSELNGLDLTVLLPSFESKMVKIESTGKSWDLPLIRHGGTKIDIQFSPTVLDSQKRLVAIYLLPVTLREQRRIERQRQSDRWQALNDHVSAFQQPELNQALNLGLNAASNFTGAPVLAIYQVNDSLPSLERTYSIGDSKRLPEKISTLDLSILHKPILWIAGKRPACDFHRYLRSNGLAYAASIPIGEPKAMIGMVIAAGDITPPPSELIPALEVAANHLFGLIQKNATLKSIQDQLESQLRQVNLGNALRDAVQDGIILISPEFTILEMNPAAEEMLGYSSQEVFEHLVDNILVVVAEGEPRKTPNTRTEFRF